jgi:hypothetical protein
MFLARARSGAYHAVSAGGRRVPGPVASSTPTEVRMSHRSPGGRGLRPSRRVAVLALVLAGAVLGAAASIRAQVSEGFWSGVRPWVRDAVPEQPGNFTFCRLMYDSIRREAMGLGWTTDYPVADQNLMIRFSEFTTSSHTRWADGLPAHAVVRATDPAIFRCPFLFASDVGTAGLREEEVEALREYLLKGGFLWVDDFWGETARAHWLRQIGRVIPEFEVMELAPEHPLLSTFYSVERVPQVPSIQFWRRSGGQTSERGRETETPTLSAIVDERGRPLVLMSHNTDLADGWERESEEEEFFRRFSPFSYAVAINVLVWAMTH